MNRLATTLLRPSATSAFARAATRRSYHATQVRFADEAVDSSKVKLSLCTPTEALFHQKNVDMVIIPGAAGEYGVTGGHQAVISELKSGVVKVYADENGEPEEFFVSGGFAITKEDSTTDVAAVEAFKLEDLDADAVRQGLASSKSKLDAATPETVEHAIAQIEFDTHEAMSQALGLSA